MSDPALILAILAAAVVGAVGMAVHRRATEPEPEPVPAPSVPDAEEMQRQGRAAVIEQWRGCIAAAAAAEVTLGEHAVSDVRAAIILTSFRERAAFARANLAAHGAIHADA